MATSRDKLEELNLSRDEVERIGEALKKEEFRKLLLDYVEEIQDPENRKLYEKEIIQLEKERGVDVTFINPTPGYVIKTSVNGNQKAFINICANENIKKPVSTPVVQQGSSGLQWSLPHSITPPREDVDNKKVRCKVYDVVFHPNTLHLAHKNKAFQNMINTTALNAIEDHFAVKLDKKNLRFPKLKYKGFAHASVIRTPSGDKPVERSPEDKQFYDNLYKNADEAGKWQSQKSNKKEECNDTSKYTTPKYLIKHRSHVEYEDFTEHKGAKLNAAIPKELVVEIQLPLLKLADDISLDVTEKTLQLISEKPAKYKLNLTLPYVVNSDMGNAKFEKDVKKLVITLPVKRLQNPLTIPNLNRDDSGVESDHGSPTSIDSPLGNFEENYQFVSEIKSEVNNREMIKHNSPHYRTSFLDENVHYTIPEYTCHVFENIVSFTLNVKNVDENSIKKLYDDAGSSFHIKFNSISSSFFTVSYAFYVSFPSQVINKEQVCIEPWDNNIVVQIPINKTEINSYFVGLHEKDLHEKYIQEPAILNNVLQKSTLEEITELEEQQSELSSNEHNFITKEMAPIEEVEEIKENVNEKPATRAIDIINRCYESSGDELSYSYSPSRSKGILKRLSSNRKGIGRSISESSLDDFICSSSFENCHTSVDSVIPEDGEVSTSLKKTVRFNSVISKQVYRSNSSILGQKKKNQRKARNKKRAQERRASESDVSELEEKKEESDSKTTTSENLNSTESDEACETDKKEDHSNIFAIDDIDA